MSDLINVDLVEDTLAVESTEEILSFTIEETTLPVTQVDDVLQVESNINVILVDTPINQLNISTTEEVLEFTFSEVFAPVQVIEGDINLLNEILGTNKNVQFIDQFIAGEALDAKRVVFLNNGSWYYGDNTLNIHSGIRFGITLEAVSIGNTIKVQTNGYLNEGTWTWDVTKPLFLGINGLITQIKPTNTLLTLGNVLTANTIYININKPIKLSP